MRRSAVVGVVGSVVLVATGLTAAAHATPSGAANPRAGTATTAWHRVPSPVPASRTRPGRYAGVSCPTSSFCMAVASGFGPRGYRVGIAEVERHGRWTAEDTPPIGPTRSSLSGVSCASATSCVVVGAASVVTSPVILRWNGAHWRVLTGPATRGGGAVTAVSCATADYCVALGTKHDWVVRGDRLTPVAPADVETAISCLSATYCLAAGSVERSGQRLSLVERWDGSTWSDVPGGDVPGGHRLVTLTGVSCTAVAECSVVGDVMTSSTSGTRYRYLAETDVSGRWHRTILPTAAAAGVHRTAFGVSCTSPGRCVAPVLGRVGSRPATELLAGGRGGWALEPLRYTRGAPVTARLTAASCTSGGCALVGGGRGGDPSGRIVHELDGQARDLAPAAIRQADSSALSRVSCAGSLCLAVGRRSVPGSPVSPFAVATTGGPWHGVAAPRVRGELTDVSCVTAQFCMAIGVGLRRTVGTAAIRTGTGWHTVTVHGGPVRGVTCASTRFCAGSPIHRGDHLRWQVWRPRTGWRTETLAPPTGLRRSGPISCASATDCWTTRTYYGADEAYHATASHWDGSAWTTQQLQTDFVGDISCPSTDRCLAPGTSGSQVWDGTSWTAVPYANAATLNSPRLSCVAADNCTVLGGTPSETATDTITQHWDGGSWGGQLSYPISVFDVASLGCHAAGCVTVGADPDRAEIPAILQNY